MLSLFCLLCTAFGIKLSWRKAVRGSALVWIGISFCLDLAEGFFRLTITTKYAAELSSEFQEVKTLSMLGLKHLRRLTGKMSWAAGVVPRSRWTVSIFYAVLTDAESEKDRCRGGTEVRKRGS